jgi:hypothetical protein
VLGRLGGGGNGGGGSGGGAGTCLQTPCLGMWSVEEEGRRREGFFLDGRRCAICDVRDVQETERGVVAQASQVLLAIGLIVTNNGARQQSRSCSKGSSQTCIQTQSLFTAHLQSYAGFCLLDCEKWRLAMLAQLLARGEKGRHELTRSFFLLWYWGCVRVVCVCVRSTGAAIAGVSICLSVCSVCCPIQVGVVVRSFWDWALASEAD